MKDTIKTLITHFFVITVSVLFVISLANLIDGAKYYPASYPWMVLITGALTALPSLIFFSKKELSKNSYRIRTVINFLINGSIVMILGYLWKWYTSFGYALLVFLMYVFVYAIVCAYSYFVQYHTAQSINKALERFNSDENNQE